MKFLGSLASRLGFLLCASTNLLVGPAVAASLAEEWLGPFRVVGLPAEAVSFSVLVMPADKGLGARPLVAFGHRDRVAMNPASTIKLVTTAAALDLLGPDYRPVTKFFALGPVSKGVLKGGLGILGGGDPKFVVEDLRAVIGQLRAQGIRRIEGRFVLDGSRYQEPTPDPSAFDGQPLKPYNVPPHAAMMNFKAVRLGLSTDQGRLSLTMEPVLADLRLESKVRLVKGGCEKNRFDFRQASLNTLEVSGLMGQKCEGFERYLAIYDHAQFAYRLFAKAWRDAGGSIAAKPEKAVIPPQAKLLLAWTSPRPLLEILGEINKRSNNPMARTVFLELSASAQGDGTRTDASERVKQWLTSKGLPMPELVIENGSGLSRRERISTGGLTALLAQRLSQPDPFPWIETLALAGLEGTVRKRLGADSTVGRAWIKTGSLEDVRSIAGYALSDSGRWVVFSVFVNHPQAGLSKPVLDQFVEKLVGTY